MHKHIIGPGKGFVVLGSHDNRIIAGAVFFICGERVIYKYGASDKRHQDLRANNLVMWHAIKNSCGEGRKDFSFGRTEMENKGLQQFKSGWGAEENEIRYFRYDFRKARFVKDSPTGTLVRKLFQKTPLPVLNFVGSALYRHVG